MPTPGRRKYSSRNKFVPWLTVYMRRTEDYYNGSDEGVGSLTGTTTGTSTYSCQECILATYDRYCEGESGGPALTYWWKMGPAPCGYDAGWTATVSVTMSNRGTAVPSGFYGIINTQTVTQTAAICLNTCDDVSAKKYDVSGTLTNLLMYARNVLLDGTQPFTIGLWFKGPSFNNNRDLLFQSNLGGARGYYRGVWASPVANGSIYVQFGDNLGNGGGNRWSHITTTSLVVTAMANFVVLYVDPKGDPITHRATTSSLTFKLYVNGIEATLSYQSGSLPYIEFPIDEASAPAGLGGTMNGVGFPGDLKNLPPLIGYDECFVHMGEITAGQVLRMWQLGTTV